MNKYLLNCYPIILKKELAVKFNLKKAIILQQIFYWINHNKSYNKNYIDGKYWTYKTLEEWNLQFPFWSLRTIKSIFQELKSDGIITAQKLSANSSDQTLWYTIEDIEDTSSLIHQLLFEKYPLVINPYLAHKIGLNEAIVLQQLEYWISHNKEKEVNFYEGSYWVHQSFDNWGKQFPFLSERTLKRTFSDLEKMSLVKTGNFNQDKFNKTKWYTINYNHKLFTDPEFIQNTEFPDSAKMARSIRTVLEPNNPLLLPAKIEEKPDDTHSAKMAQSSMPNLHNDIYKETNIRERRASAREEISINTFSISEEEKNALAIEFKMTDAEVYCALNEFKLHQNELTVQQRDILLKRFKGWCSRFGQIKKPEHRKAINSQYVTNNPPEVTEEFKNGCEYWCAIQSKDSGIEQKFFEDFIKKIGHRAFREWYLYTLKMRKNNDGCLKLFLSDYKAEYYFQVRKHINKIAEAIKGITNDLKGIEFYQSEYSNPYMVKIDFDKGM